MTPQGKANCAFSEKKWVFAMLHTEWKFNKPIIYLNNAHEGREFWFHLSVKLILVDVYVI